MCGGWIYPFAVHFRWGGGIYPLSAWIRHIHLMPPHCPLRGERGVDHELRLRILIKQKLPEKDVFGLKVLTMMSI